MVQKEENVGKLNAYEGTINNHNDKAEELIAAVRKGVDSTIEELNKAATTYEEKAQQLVDVKALNRALEGFRQSKQEEYEKLANELAEASAASAEGNFKAAMSDFKGAQLILGAAKVEADKDPMNNTKALDDAKKVFEKKANELAVCCRRILQTKENRV